MRRLFNLLAAVTIAFSFTSCEQTVAIDESPIKGTWECCYKNVPMALIFSDKEVEYTLYLESFESRATYFGTYTIIDTTITINFDSIKINKVTKPKVTYTSPDQMPTDAVLRGDSAIVYFDYTFKRVNECAYTSRPLGGVN